MDLTRNALRRCTSVTVGWVLLAGFGTVACSNQSDTLSAETTQQFARVYTDLASGAISQDQYRAAVGDIATSLPDNQARTFINCAESIGAEADGAKLKAVVESFTDAVGGGPAKASQGSGTPSQSSESANPQAPIDAFGSAVAALPAAGDAELQRCQELLGVNPSP